MNQLLINPGFQSAIVPFVVAVIVALALKRLGGPWPGLGFAAGYFSSVYLAAGFDLVPLTSSRKAILLGAVAVVIGLILELRTPPRRFLNIFVSVTTMLATLWIISSKLGGEVNIEWWLVLAGCLTYAVLGTHLISLTSNSSSTNVVTLTALGIGTGVSAILGASALLGQLAGGVAAATGAYIVFHVVKKPVPTGYTVSLPASLILVLTGISAVLYARLPWYVLIPLALVPAAACLPLVKRFSGLKQILLVSILTFTPVAVAIALTWNAAGPLEY